MSVEGSESRIQARVWQAIAQSGVNLSGLPREEVEKLVQYITAAVMLEVDATLADAAEVQGIAPAGKGMDVPLDDEEKVLWEGRPLMSLVERYVVTNQRVRIISGLLGKAHENIELVRLRDVDYKHGLGERMLNVGDIILHSADASHPYAVLRNVTDPEQVHEIIRKAMLAARRGVAFSFQEEM